MIKKFKSIGNLAVFKDFDWDQEVLGEKGSVDFQKINIIYGRNYSGKTTLSRILRAMETGQLSNKFENPSFSVALKDGTEVTQASLLKHDKTIRVFNEDFVRDNLYFISNPDDSIESFAILGDDNVKIEREIEALEAELGSKEEGKESGLYAKKAAANGECVKASKEHKEAEDDLESQLRKKATDKEIGIKYQPNRFGDQNYDIQKLRKDIGRILHSEYQRPTDHELELYEKSILEKALPSIPLFSAPRLEFEALSSETYELVTKEISASDKIEELVREAQLHRWVNEGRTLHEGKRKRCAFCDNPISEDRWKKLDKHFDEESYQLEKKIDALIAKVDDEQKKIQKSLSIDKSQFYSNFHSRLDELNDTLQTVINQYLESLDNLSRQLKARKEDILNQKAFEKPDDLSTQLLSAWHGYECIQNESNDYTGSLKDNQSKAREVLRLKEVSDFSKAIGYQERMSSIEQLKEKLALADEKRNGIEGEIRRKEELIASKKRELNDEEKGAQEVNRYLNNFFGHKYLTLEATKEQNVSEESKQIRFEVKRDGKKAYHLSEGECSLLAFCYFLAKLGDTSTRGSEPIIWIDDPISSLDENHIFFVYSLINAEIVAAKKFEQLFISTHNLNFLKYLKRIDGKVGREDKKGYFVVTRNEKHSTIGLMPEYLKKYVTEFNHLFHQIYRCSKLEMVDDKNYVTFYNFANNARKFLEIYLYYKYPDQGMTKETLASFFGEEKIPAVLTDRINNEYSHLCGVFERGSMPVVVPEMQTAAAQIIDRLRKDNEQYSALLRSIGETEGTETRL